MSDKDYSRMNFSSGNSWVRELKSRVAELKAERDSLSMAYSASTLREIDQQTRIAELENPWVSVDTRPKTTDMSKDYYLSAWRNGRYSINGESYIRANADEITHWMPIPEPPHKGAES